MKTFRVRVIQSYQVTRTINMDVEADSIESAIEHVASGSMDVPEFDAVGWRTGWDLQSEKVEEA